MIKSLRSSLIALWLAACTPSEVNPSLPASDGGIDETITTGSDVTPDGDVSEPPLSCPGRADACAPACKPVFGFRVDTTRVCFGSAEVISCVRPGTPSAQIESCVILLVSGELYKTNEIQDALDLSIWRHCTPTDDEYGISARAKPCAADRD